MRKETQELPGAKDPKSPAQKDREIDEQIEDSFPASDPPSYSGGSRAGSPKARRPQNEKPDDKSR